MLGKKKDVSAGDRKVHNKQAGMLAIIAGILLIIAGVTGAAAWEAIQSYVEDTFGDNATMEIVFLIFILIASLGGIVVVLGGWLFMREKVRTAKFLLMLGVGMGLVGLIITVMVAIKEGTMLNLSAIGLGFVGIILSVVARSRAVAKDIKK